MTAHSEITFLKMYKVYFKHSITQTFFLDIDVNVYAHVDKYDVYVYVYVYVHVHKRDSKNSL